jgi:hypothetical protein
MLYGVFVQLDEAVIYNRIFLWNIDSVVSQYGVGRRLIGGAVAAGWF